MRVLHNSKRTVAHSTKILLFCRSLKIQEMEGGDPWSWIYEWACVKRNKVLVEGACEHEKRVAIDARLQG